LQVRKTTDDESTLVEVTALDGEARVAELARMMGRESDANLRHARELLEGVQSKSASGGTATKSRHKL
jgi:DNA repair ATPase RecN